MNAETYSESCQESKKYLFEESVNDFRPLTFFTKSFIRSSHCRCSVKKGVLENFAKFTRKHLCQSLSFNKVECLRPYVPNKRPLPAYFFSKNFLPPPLLLGPPPPPPPPPSRLLSFLLCDINSKDS